jgi:hypothetical protein
VGLGLWCGVLPPVGTVAAHPGHSHGAAPAAQGHHVIRGEDGWELAIHTSPERPHVGALVPLDLWLRKDGVVFAGLTEVALSATNLDAGQPVVETHVLAREGQSTQHLQLYEAGLHAIAVTVRHAGDAAHGWVPRTVVLNMDVLALPAPFTAQLRLMAMGLGVLVLGMGVGFGVPRLVLTPGR